MFGEWVRWWYKAFSWWLPSAEDDKEEPRSKQEAKPTSPSQPQSPQASPSPRPEPQPAAAPQGAAQPAASADDLTQIKGIGPALSKRLNAAGIASFRDLASADPGELARKLDSRPITADRVRGWIDEAKKRVSA